MIERRIQGLGATPEMEAAPSLTVDDLVSTPRSGLLVAEGGMGKSTFLEDFAERVGDKAAFIKLAYFAHNPQGLANKIEGAAKAGPGHTLILDGLDEALDLAGTLCQCVKELPDNSHVWIASRECRQLAAVSGALKRLERYRLLPFSRDDIKTRAQEKTLEVSAVEDLLREHDLWSICGNPQGCDFVLEAFKQHMGRGAWTSLEIWRQGILALCDETDSEPKSLDKNAGQFSVDQVYACAAWIALNLNLSGKNAVFTGVRETECPSQALPVSALVSEGAFSCALIESTLPRGVFLPWGGERSGFAHATYSDYLAAEGFRRHVPRGQWESLLLDRENRCLFPQRTGVAQWLMADDAALADQIYELSPESLLTYDLARLKRDGLCQTLLDRADSVLALGWGSGRSWKVLKSPVTLGTLRAYIASQGSRWATELAIDIARDCEYWQLLADFALDETRDESRRQDAVFALSRCPDIEIKRRLRPLLDRLADRSDRWRGSLLFVCWPDVLSVDEVLPFVVFPNSMSSVESGGYRSFLRRSFIGPLFERLNPVVSSSPLAWANTWLEKAHGNSTGDEIKGGARAVYTRFWNHAAGSGAEAIVSLLTDGYLAARKHYESPFFSVKDVKLFGNYGIAPECNWSQEAFVGQRELRFAILREIIARRALESMSAVALGVDFALIQNDDDLIHVARIILAAPVDEDADQWGLLLRYSWSRHFLETQGEIVDRIHVARTDIFPKTCGEILAEGEAYQKKWNETERKHKAVMDSAAAEQIAWQQWSDREIKNALASDNVQPEQFLNISANLYSNDGDVEDWAELDFRQTIGWKKLTVAEQERLIRLAERFLLSVPPSDSAEERGINLAWHCALIVLKRDKPGIYEGLPEEVWRKCAVELLRFHANEACQELYVDLARKFPDAAQDALIRCLQQEHGILALKAWGARLNEACADTIWNIIFDTHSREADYIQPVRCFSKFPSTRRTPVENPVCDQMLSCLAQHQPDVVRRRVNEWLKDGFAIHLGHPFYDVLRRYALQLDVETHFPTFLRTVETQPDWGRIWFEASVDRFEWHTEGVFSNAFFSRPAEEIGKLYEWLNRQYPPEMRPRHKSGTSYVPSALDHLFHFKEDLFKVLIESGKTGSARVVEELIAKCPGIFAGHVATARRNEAAARLPTLSVEEIRELTKEKKAVIASVGDLQKLVLSLLNDYQVWLKGKTPAVEDLWDTAVPSPKKEEAFSGHLERFLRDRLPRATFANREVQISRKLAEGGENGARTDIWIDCETICQEKVSLCIEVKCSWNREAKTAISDQLASRYMSAGRADAGILLLAWFHCAAWKTEKKSVWPSLGEAREALEQQAKVKSEEIGKPVAAFVLDCTL